MNLKRLICLLLITVLVLPIMPVYTYAEDAVYDSLGYTLAESTLAIFPKSSKIEQGADGGTTSTFFRLIEYPKGNVNEPSGRVALIRYDISDVPENADLVTASIGMNYHQASGYGHAYEDNNFTIGVYQVDENNLKWNWTANGSARSITYSDIFVTPPADSVAIRTQSTLIDTVTAPDDIKKVTYTHTSAMANGIRVEADITECVKGIKAVDPNAQYVTLMFGVDSFESNGPDVNASNGTILLNFRGEKFVGGSNYSNYDEFRPRVEWYSKRRSTVNTIETLDVSNGILSEPFNPDATDEGETLVKTYKIGVIDESQDVELTYVLTSDKATVSGEVTTGNMNGERNLTIPVTSEAGETRYYNFELVSATELGYSRDGKFSMDKLEYEENSISGASVNLVAKLMNNCLLNKDAARVTLYLKENKIINSEIEIYNDLGFGPVDEIRETITVGDADKIITWFSDVSDGLPASDIVYPIGSVAVISKTTDEIMEKSEEDILVSYPDANKSEALICGKAEASSALTVFVMNKNADLSGFDYNNADFEEYFTFAGGVNSDADGYYGIIAGIPDSGEYKIVVANENGQVKTSLISYISAGDRIIALQELYGASSADELKAKLALSLTEEEREELEDKYIETDGAEGAKNYVKILGLSVDEFGNGVSEEQFTKILYNKLRNEYNYDNFYKLYEEALELAKIYSGKAEDISVFNENIVISAEYLAIYNTLSEESKKKVSSERLTQKDFYSYDDVSKAAEKEILLEKVSVCENTVEFNEFLHKFADKLKISSYISGLDELESFRKNAMISEMIKIESFATIEEFASVFAENLELIISEVIEFALAGNTTAVDTIIISPANKDMSGANGGVENDFYRIWEYPDGHANKKYGRVGIVKYDISNIPSDADLIKVSIGCTYHAATGYGNEWVNRDFEMGVYALKNEDMKWQWEENNGVLSLPFANVFNKVPADSFAIRNMATKLGTIKGKSDGEDDIELIKSEMTTSLYASGIRAACDVTDYVNKVRLENPEEKYIYIMYTLDSFVLNEGEPSFGLYIRNEHHVSNGTDTQHAFRPQVLWYDIMASKVNTINSVNLSNGILTEEFDPEATDGGENLEKTYKVAVMDETKDVVLTYKKSSGKSTVSGEITTGNLNGNKVLTVPVTSEAGETRTYNFELVPAEEVGYSKNGPLHVRDLKYDVSELTPNSLIYIKAKLENKSFKNKKAARISIYHKDNKVSGEKFKDYTGLKPGICDEISVGINTSDADEIVTWIADISDDNKLYTALIPRGKVITLSKAPSTWGKSENLVEYYYKDVTKPVITFSGKWHTKDTGVAAYIVDKNTDITAFDYDFDTFEDYFVYAGAVNTDKDGYYGFDAKISSSGDYKLVLMDGNGKMEECSFYFATPAEKDAALVEIYKNKEADVLRSKLMLTATSEERAQALNEGKIPYDYVKLFALPVAEINVEITEANMLSLLSSLIKRSTDPDEFLKLYNDAILIEKVNAGKISDINDISDKIVFTEDLAEFYNSFDNATKANILSVELAGKGFGSYEEISKKLKEVIVAKFVSTTKNSEQLSGVLSDYSDVFGITTLAAYNSLNSVKQRAVIDAVINNQPYSDVSKAREIFDTMVAEMSRPEASAPAGGGGGGGGGGGAGPAQKIEVSGNTEGNLNADVIENIRICNFKDLNGYDWAKTAIVSLYEKHLIDGTGETSFNPSGKVKREEFIKMIDSLYEGENKDNGFSDVSENSWYAPYVNKAVNAGIIKGVDAKHFGTGLGVTRQDMAVIIARVLGAELSTGNSGFADDAEIASYAKESVTTLKKLGVISGSGEGKFNPKSVMTRAEAAVVIYNILNMEK